VSTPTQTTVRSAAPQQRRRRLAAAVVAGVLGAAGGFGVGALTRGQSHSKSAAPVGDVSAAHVAGVPGVKSAAGVPQLKTTTPVTKAETPTQPTSPGHKEPGTKPKTTPDKKPNPGKKEE
jgi:hypothetical protein